MMSNLLPSSLGLNSCIYRLNDQNPVSVDQVSVDQVSVDQVSVDQSSQPRLTTARCAYSFLFLLFSLLSLIILKDSTHRAYAQNGCDFPNVLLIVDRSGSMHSGQIGDQTKWDIASIAIESMLSEYAQSVHFGLMLYPGPSGSGENGVTGAVGACRWNLQDDVCTPSTPRCTTGEVVVDIGPNTSQAIQDEMIWPNNLAHSYTPTWQSIEAARQYAPLTQGPGDKYVILLTDGWQCCGLYQNQNGGYGCEAESRSLPVDKIRELRVQGVTPFVIGFGGSVDVSTLQQMAVEAQTQRPGCDPSITAVDSDQLCYYQASDSQSLNSFLTEIARQISDEVCDQIDNDCDGQIDEGLIQMCTSQCGEGVSECEVGGWGECSAPTPTEEQCNGLDDDCDGQSDEALTQQCSTACGVGQERCVNGAWMGCDAPPVQDEECNSLDDNCDGQIDEGCECIDGQRQPCGESEGRCEAGQQFCQDQRWGECEGALTPQEELCNELDDDCDGEVDEDLTQECSNACGAGSSVCERGQWTMCTAPAVPEEMCNGVDDDCDGVQDEGELCGDDSECRCGGCVPRCAMNECNNGGLCIEGYCEVDQCPDGSFCQEGRCMEGESPFEAPIGGSESSQPVEGEGGEMVSAVAQPVDGCQSSKQINTSPWFILILLYLLNRGSFIFRSRSFVFRSNHRLLNKFLLI